MPWLCIIEYTLYCDVWEVDSCRLLDWWDEVPLLFSHDFRACYSRTLSIFWLQICWNSLSCKSSFSDVSSPGFSGWPCSACLFFFSVARSDFLVCALAELPGLLSLLTNGLPDFFSLFGGKYRARYC